MPLPKIHKSTCELYYSAPLLSLCGGEIKSARVWARKGEMRNGECSCWTPRNSPNITSFGEKVYPFSLKPSICRAIKKSIEKISWPSWCPVSTTLVLVLVHWTWKVCSGDGHKLPEAVETLWENFNKSTELALKSLDLLGWNLYLTL